MVPVTTLSASTPALFLVALLLSLLRASASLLFSAVTATVPVLALARLLCHCGHGLAESDENGGAIDFNT